MTTPPVSVGELRSQINYPPGSSQANDEELYGHLLAATRTVEARCGAMEPRTVTSTILPQDGLPEWPILSVQTVGGVAVDPSPITYSRFYSSRWSPAPITVVYKVGRDPVPEDLRLATLIVAAHLWETQRGPVGMAPTSFTGVASGGVAVMPRGFALPNRALELMEPYMASVIG